MDKYIVTKDEIDDFEGLHKVHFLNDGAVRTNKSLGDLTGLTGIGFHIIEVAPGMQTSEFHRHHFEDECVYILQGAARAVIGDETHDVGPGDFIGYRAGGAAHTLINSGDEPLRCIVVGARRAHDVGDYPEAGKRIYKNKGMAWNLVDLADIEEPDVGKK